MILFSCTNFSTSRVLSTVFVRAQLSNDGPSVQGEILAILVHSLWFLLDLVFREVVKLLQGEHGFVAVSLFLGFYEPLRSKAMLYIGPLRALTILSRFHERGLMKVSKNTRIPPRFLCFRYSM